MVGVPGKYKGCNTCRARRVKCDNEKPLCRKCLDSGRECQGYERETIFIVGTLEDKGRCSSHPPRNMKSPKGTPSPPRTSGGSASHLVPLRPLRSAWDDVVPVSRSGRTYQLRIAAVHMPVDAVVINREETDSILSLPSYTPMNVQPTFGEEDFLLRCRCLAHLSSSHEGMFLCLYEHNSSLSNSGQSTWKDAPHLENGIKQLGPNHFTSFPAHHFFVRVYRPAAIVTALLNRKPTFCGDAEWVTSPWELHPKAPLDRLLDILSQIPALLQRLDHLLVMEPTSTRRQFVQDLLENCLSVHAALEQWHASLHSSTYRSQAAYWISPDQSQAQMPFASVISFRDALTSITFLFYWAAQILFHPCIELLYHTYFSPVIDSYSDVYPSLPVHLNIDPDAFGTQNSREVAAQICRGLDAALAASTQPDLLAFPVQMAETLYGGLSAVAPTGEGAMELMWLAGFRARMMARGQAIASAAVGRRWTELPEW